MAWRLPTWRLGHQVIGDAVGVLADQAGLVGTDGVEVTKQGHVQGGVSLADIGQDALGKGLGGAVGVGGGTHGEVLCDGHAGGVAVDGGGGAEHEVAAIVAAHHVQNDQGAVEVVIVVLDGLGNALAHSLIGGKLDDSIDIRALGEDLLHVLVLCHIGLIEPEVLAGDLLDPIQHHGGSVVIVICHHDVKASVQQFDTGVAADITGTAGNQNCHKSTSLLVTKVACAGQARLLPQGYNVLAAESSNGNFIRMDFCFHLFSRALIYKRFLCFAHGVMERFVQIREKALPGKAVRL